MFKILATKKHAHVRDQAWCVSMPLVQWTGLDRVACCCRLGHLGLLLRRGGRILRRRRGCLHVQGAVHAGATKLVQHRRTKLSTSVEVEQPMMLL